MAWATAGNIKGPKGDTGDTGPKGDKGDDGAGIAIGGSVATYADLPTDLTSADAGKGYLVQADGDLYIWDGSAFPADGAGTAFQGPPGTPGADGATPDFSIGTVATGAAGSSASATIGGTASEPVLNLTIPRGDKGNTGDTGTAGSDGADGTNGSKWFNGTGAPGSVPGAVAGDYYLDTADGTVYVLS